MNKSWIFFKRECLVRVKTKGFIIGTFVSPLFVILLIVLPGLFIRTGTEGETSIAVADFTGRLVPHLEAYVQQSKTDKGGNALYRIAAVQADSTGLDSLKRRMNAELLGRRVDVFLILPADIFRSNGYELYAKNVGNFQLNESLNGMMTAVVSNLRLTDSGLDPAVVGRLNRRVTAATFKVAEGGARKESGELAFLLSYVMVFMLYMVLIFYGQFVMRGVIEDKSSRVVEVLLSSARPHEIMTGKILGIGAAGLIQMAVWGLCLLLMSVYGALLVPADKIPIPSLSVWTVLAFLAFFVIGYFLYASLYAALGSTGNVESEMQNLQWPALAPLIFAMIVMMAIVKNPEGTMAVVLSMIPFFSPMLMFLRISLHAAPLGQVLICFVLCLLTIAGMIWLAGRIFRVGILMYGKRPTLPEVLKWIKYS